jgi:hypothetical protein
MKSSQTASRAPIFTSFGTRVFVDASGELRHGASESCSSNLFLQPNVDPGGNQHSEIVHLTNSGTYSPIYRAADGQLLSSSVNDTEHSASFELISLERGLIALRSNGLFLSALPDGRLSLSASVCSTWELFLTSENWCTDQYFSQLISQNDNRDFDVQKIQNYIIHPAIRTRTQRVPPERKLLIYGYTQWSHGRVYYDLCKLLHGAGYVVDILDWRLNHAEHISELTSYYDVFLTALDGVTTLVDQYNIPFEKIIGLAHHEFEVRMLIERKGYDAFEKLAKFAVVSEFVYCASLMQGVKRPANVVPLGINYANFYAPPAACLESVGYASSMSSVTYGVEWKRGVLAERAARQAGLNFIVAGSTGNQVSFHDMPQFYKGVGAVLTSSVSEAAQLPPMEAAAAGRLVIGTPVGHFPLKAYQGAGILAPIEEEKFVSFAADTLCYYRDNPSAYLEKCHAIQEAARGSDWSHFVADWINLIATA